MFDWLWIWLGYLILHETDTTNNSGDAFLFWLQIELDLNVSSPARIRVGFWYFCVDFGLIRFFKGKKKVSHKSPYYCLKRLLISFSSSRKWIDWKAMPVTKKERIDIILFTGSSTTPNVTRTFNGTHRKQVTDDTVAKLIMKFKGTYFIADASRYWRPKTATDNQYIC